ncbi:hypothetical protein RI138_18400 [Streptomyces sp. C11-1]|uniref:Uncharacterized protein n=1 Tax=Streptomyces durocortorensis TaxID=2811104 RepID=A0ABY9W189_9ACTN|nr:hypothetical protein [Streptomyces durocortorensis]WNF28645.1 hypothetical protein RI138_18400 [Streptomyces durocortorensis]
MSAARRLLSATAVALALVASLAAGIALDELAEPGAEIRSQGAQDSAGWG